MLYTSEPLQVAPASAFHNESLARRHSDCQDPAFTCGLVLVNVAQKAGPRTPSPPELEIGRKSKPREINCSSCPLTEAFDAQLTHVDAGRGAIQHDLSNRLANSG